MCDKNNHCRYCNRQEKNIIAVIATVKKKIDSLLSLFKFYPLKPSKKRFTDQSNFVGVRPCVFRQPMCCSGVSLGSFCGVLRTVDIPATLGKIHSVSVRTPPTRWKHDKHTMHVCFVRIRSKIKIALSVYFQYSTQTIVIMLQSLIRPTLFGDTCKYILYMA